MKKLYTLSLFLAFAKLGISQDIEMRSITSPVSGCNLSASETVTVVVRTNTDISTSFDVSFVLNGTLIATETYPVTTTILANSNLTYSFTAKADLSTPGTYTFDAYTNLAGDVNRSNDTLKGYIVVSDAPSDGGEVTGGGPVCLTGNSGTLTLINYTGTIQRWESSTDNGSNWVLVSNTSSSLNYNNVSENILYRAVVKNGSCPSANSIPDTLTVDSATIGGTTRIGTATTITVCSGSNSGTIRLLGHRGSVMQWEFSEDAGATWNLIANTNTSHVFSNLVTSTRFRARVKNGACTDTISSFVTVNVSQPTVGGAVTPDTTVCSGSNTGVLTLSGHTGAILRWQYSTNGGASYINLANTTTKYTFNNLTTTTKYRAQVRSGACPIRYSTPATVTVSPGTIAGTVAGSDTVCKGANMDTLALSGQNGNILNWEFSIDNGGIWNVIADTNDTLIFNDLLVTTQYRAFVQLGSCPGTYSTIATITVDSTSKGGTVTGDATVCSGSNSGMLSLNGYRGDILNWEYSNDSLTWLDTAVTGTALSYSNLTATTYYRAEVKNGVCPADTSAPAVITVDPATAGGSALIAATGTSSTVACAGFNSGTITLTGRTGNVLNWEYSTDGGLTWINIVNTDTFQNYNNLITATLYRALVKSGVCNPVYSAPATITTTPVSEGGILYGSTTACSGANSGTLTLVGFSGKILNWESSTDSGLTWNNIPDTTFSRDYNDLNEETWFRAVVQSGVCPADTSSPAIINIDPVSVGGSISADDTVCAAANRDTLVLSGLTGTVTGWEISTDNGITWINVANTTTTQVYNNLEKTTMYRASVKSGVCPVANSDTALIVVDPESEGGAIMGGESVCGGENEGTLTLSDYTGSVLTWQSSVNGGISWDSLANTSAVYNYIDIDTNTWFRAMVKSGVCAADTSGIAEIILKNNPVADAGEDTTISLGSSVELTGRGGVIFSWSPGATLNDSTSSMPVASPTENTTYILTVTDINGCTDTAAVVVMLSSDFSVTPFNLLTPNGDGFNDTWSIGNIDNYPDNKVIVFNRMGQTVFEADNYANNWDGTYNGKTLPDGTYYYVITFTGSDKAVKGAINILKGNN